MYESCCQGQCACDLSCRRNLRRGKIKRKGVAWEEGASHRPRGLQPVDNTLQVAPILLVQDDTTELLPVTPSCFSLRTCSVRLHPERFRYDGAYTKRLQRALPYQSSFRSRRFASLAIACWLIGIMAVRVVFPKVVGFPIVDGGRTVRRKQSKRLRRALPYLYGFHSKRFTILAVAC